MNFSFQNFFSLISNLILKAAYCITETDMDDDSNDYVNTEIVCTLAALGYIEGDEYYKGDDCLGK